MALTNYRHAVLTNRVRLIVGATLGALLVFASAAVAGPYSPRDIVATPDGRVWFIDGEGAVGILDPLTGAITQHVLRARLGSKRGFVIDLAIADGQVWAATRRGVARLHPDGTMDEYSLGSEAAAIATGPDGALWLTLPGMQAVARFTPDGARAIWPTAPGSLETIAEGPRGDMWYVDGGDILARLKGGGPLTMVRLGRISTHWHQEEWRIPVSNLHPYDLVGGPDGDLWATLSVADRIARIDRHLRARFFRTPVGLRSPASIVVGPDKALWFVGRRDGAIGRLTPGGKFTVVRLRRVSPDRDPSPENLTVAPDGSLWFTESDRDLVVRMTTTGQMHEYSIPFLSISALKPLIPGVAPPAIPLASQESLKQPE